MKESNTPQGQDNTADRSNNPKNRSALGNAPPRVGGNPPSPPEHNNANDDSNQPPWWRRQLPLWTFVGELVLIVITVRIACIYSGQLRQMIRGNILTEQNFAESQRPYVWLINRKENVELLFDTPDRRFIYNRPIKIRLKYQDYGLSPALITRLGYEMHIKANAARVFGGAISWIPTTSVLPPGKWDTLTPQSIENYTKGNEDAVIGDNGIAVYAVFQYTDTRKHAFETDVCFYRMENGDLNYCSPNINRIRDCEKEACTQ